MSTAEAREPRKIRRARTRANYWAQRRAAAVTPADQALIAFNQMWSALSRPEVSARVRDRAWADVIAVADRITDSVTPREPHSEVHTANVTAPDEAKAQTSVRAHAR